MVMLNKDQRGEINHLTIPFVIVLVLALGFGVFSVWAFAGYSEQKNNVDVIVATEVVEAQKAQEVVLRAEFAQEQKNPYKQYVSGSTNGSIKIVYPKTWSALIDEQETGSASFDAHFHPDFVPGGTPDTLFGARVEIVNSDYAQVLSGYQRDVEDGDLKARAIKVSGATATRFDGLIENDVTGAVVVLPLRDKTVMIWTESANYLGDFDRIIKNLTYSP